MKFVIAMMQHETITFSQLLTPFVASSVLTRSRAAG